MQRNEKQKHENREHINLRRNSKREKITDKEENSLFKKLVKNYKVFSNLINIRKNHNPKDPTPPLP